MVLHGVSQDTASGGILQHTSKRDAHGLNNELTCSGTPGIVPIQVCGPKRWSVPHAVHTGFSDHISHIKVRVTNHHFGPHGLIWSTLGTPNMSLSTTYTHLPNKCAKRKPPCCKMTYAAFCYNNAVYAVLITPASAPRCTAPPHSQR